ncbi:hypothetical protein EV424DRAFT_1539944 [Suillus variegatus]|nr:hypothetical protein EV424DRAFT_1539944 [Suillus variegatus]
MVPNRNTNGGRKYVLPSSSNNQVPCQHCNKLYSSCGLWSHEQSCLRRREKEKDNNDFAVLAAQAVEEKLERKEACRERKHLHKPKEQATATGTGPHVLLVPSASLLSEDCTENAPDNLNAGAMSFAMGSDVVDAMSVGVDSDSSMASSHGPTPPTLSSLAAETSVPSGFDTFKTEYHPKYGRATTIETFSTFRRKQDQWLPIINEEPWQPFSCHADFEFAELAHNAALNKDHTDELEAGVALPASILRAMGLTELEQKAARIPQDLWRPSYQDSEKENIPSSSSRQSKCPAMGPAASMPAKRARVATQPLHTARTLVV